MASKRDRKAAKALVDLEYGPQRNQIRDLWGQTRTQYLNDLSGARQIATGIKTEAAAAEPKVQGIYHDARADLKSSNSFVDKALAATPGGTPTGLSGLVTQAMQRERGTARNANTAARAGALTELTNRASEAEAGKALAYRAAKGSLLSARKGLTQRLADLSGQSSAKMTALLADMDTATSNARATANKTLTSGPYRGHTQAAVDAASPGTLRAWERQNTKTAGTGGGTKAKDNTKHIESVRKESGDFRVRISDAASAWDQYARQRVPKMESVNVGGKDVERIVRKDGKPVYETPSPDEIRRQLLAAKYTPGEIHIALLRRVGKPLDQAAVNYLKGLAGRGVRIPREWLEGTVIAGGWGDPKPSGGNK